MGLKDGKCETCIAEGKISTVTRPQYGSTTLMAISPGYYDEIGIFHEPYNPNRTTYEWCCSQGHKWIEIV